MLNYLARLGWSHGDDELFSREQLVAWFDGSHLARSPAQWDPAKLAWVNAQYLKQADDMRLAALVRAQLAGRGVTAGETDHLARACALFKDRCNTTVQGPLQHDGRPRRLAADVLCAGRTQRR